MNQSLYMKRTVVPATRTNFVVPPANQVLLMHADPGGFVDTSGRNHTITSFGGTQISTAQYVFGGGAAQTTTDGDYLTVNSSYDFNFGYNDFTIDFRVMFDATGAPNYNLYDARGGNLHSGEFYPAIYKDGLDNIIYHTDTNAITGTTHVTSGVWYHVAVTRRSGTTRLFMDGIQEGGNYSPGNDNLLIDVLYISAFSSTALTLVGWLDELRVINGAAIWTSNFTPPTSPYS